MNKCIFIGNLVRDPEITITGSGKKVARFTLAISRTYTNAQGEREADYPRFVAFEGAAEIAEKYLCKGRKIAVESHVKTGSYEKDGRRTFTTDFMVEHIEFVASSQQSGQATPAAAANESTGGNYPSDGFQQIDDDELPF